MIRLLRLGARQARGPYAPTSARSGYLRQTALHWPVAPALPWRNRQKSLWLLTVLYLASGWIIGFRHPPTLAEVRRQPSLVQPRSAFAFGFRCEHQPGDAADLRL
jgi:hypothetical protein